MTIRFNGETREIADDMSLAELLEQIQDLPENFAVAINEDFVPRSAYNGTQVQAGDAVELLVPMQGG